MKSSGLHSRAWVKRLSRGTCRLMRWLCAASHWSRMGALPGMSSSARSTAESAPAVWPLRWASAGHASRLSSDAAPKQQEYAILT